MPDAFVCADCAKTSFGATIVVTDGGLDGARGGATARAAGGRVALDFDFEVAFDLEVGFDCDLDEGLECGAAARGLSQLSPASGSAGRSSDKESNDELPVDIVHHWRKGDPTRAAPRCQAAVVGRFCSVFRGLDADWQRPTSPSS